MQILHEIIQPIGSLTHSFALETLNQYFYSSNLGKWLNTAIWTPFNKILCTHADNVSSERREQPNDSILSSYSGGYNQYVSHECFMSIFSWTKMSYLFNYTLRVRLDMVHVDGIVIQRSYRLSPRGCHKTNSVDIFLLTLWKKEIIFSQETWQNCTKTDGMYDERFYSEWSPSSCWTPVVLGL